MVKSLTTAQSRALRRWTDRSVRAACNREARAFRAGLPRSSFAVLLAAVFCLFSTFGFLVDAVEAPCGAWMAAVVDVSGHGVSAG